MVLSTLKYFSNGTVVHSRTPGVATDQALVSRARCVSHVLGLHFLHGNSRASGEESKCWEQSGQGSGTWVGRVARWPLGTDSPPPPVHFLSCRVELHCLADCLRRPNSMYGEMTCFRALRLWIMDVCVCTTSISRTTRMFRSVCHRSAFLGSTVNRKHGAKNTGMIQAG